MKRKILIIFIGICILFPCSARADNQILRNIKLLYVEAQESVNKVIKYYELSQHYLQEISRARENLKNLRYINFYQIFTEEYQSIYNIC